jgi:hypothetical protein
MYSIELIMVKARINNDDDYTDNLIHHYRYEPVDQYEN